jgi:ABC-type sugar transport system substrate-binding protein
LARAVKEFGGRVDVVILYGVPGISYDDAHPWISEKRKGW